MPARPTGGQFSCLFRDLSLYAFYAICILERKNAEITDVLHEPEPGGVHSRRGPAPPRRTLAYATSLLALVSCAAFARRPAPAPICHGLAGVRGQEVLKMQEGGRVWRMGCAPIPRGGSAWRGPCAALSFLSSPFPSRRVGCSDRPLRGLAFIGGRHTPSSQRLYRS